MNKRSRACDISQKVKKEVYERDSGLCIICGRQGLPNAHYIARSHGGLGIPQNVVTLCLKCHHDYDNGLYHEKNKQLIKDYLMSCYKDWNERELYYDKWR